jgi:DNA replication protein DnaC
VTWEGRVEEYLAAVLERQAAYRESAGTMMRIRTAHFPAIKTLKDFNYDHPRPLRRRGLLAHLATSGYRARTVGWSSRLLSWGGQLK